MFLELRYYLLLEISCMVDLLTAIASDVLGFNYDYKPPLYR